MAAMVDEATINGMPWWTLLWILLGLSGSLGPVIYYAVIRRAAVSARERPARLAIGRARFIPGMPLSEIPENTVVRVRGTVRQHTHELRGPLGDRPCVYWRVTAAVQRFSERRSRYGYRHAYWQDTIDHSEGTPFVLADGSGECAVDPALGTVSVGKPTIKVVHRGQALPSRMAVVLAEQGVSLDEIRGETWRFEETLVAVGANVVVVGAGRRADRSTGSGERDYRASQATWVVLDGQELELLVTDDKRLVQQGVQAAPTDLDPRERWQGRSVVTPEASLVPLDEYEAGLRSKRRLAWITVVGALAIGATVVFGVPAVLRAMRHEDPPDSLSPEQVEVLRDITQRHRVAAYRSDDVWREAVLARDQLPIGETRCTLLGGASKDAAIPIVQLDPDHLPPQSARTTEMVRILDQLDAGFPTVPAARFPEQLALANRPQVSPLELLLELGQGQGTVVWLYDHDANRIVCRGESDQSAAAGSGSSSLFDSLRAVR